MLILERRLDQTIHIGKDIVIRVMRIRHHAIRIGIEAPPEINIARGELIPGADATAPIRDIGKGQTHA